jgi:Cu+-exporting ATPase
LTNGGELQVIDISTDEEVLLQVNSIIDKSILAQIISTIEATSTHPVATALIRSSERAQTDNEGSMQTVITILTSEEIAGMGVQAKIRLSQPRVEPTDLDVLIGNERLMRAHSCVALSVNRQRELKLWKSQAKSIVLVAFRSNGTRDLYHVAARYSIADSLRPESKSVVNHLQQQGYQVHLLSGDNTETALAIGAQVGIEPEKITAEVLPEQKGHHIQQLQRQTVLKTRVAWFPAWSFFQYKTRAVVMFVGGESAFI